MNRQQIHDYILTMLGAPVVKVELDDGNIDFCIDLAEGDLEKYKKIGNKDVSDLKYEMIIQGGALAYATLMLGRMRSVFATSSSQELCDLGNELRDEFLLNLKNIFLE